MIYSLDFWNLFIS